MLPTSQMGFMQAQACSYTNWECDTICGHNVIAKSACNDLTAVSCDCFSILKSSYS